MTGRVSFETVDTVGGAGCVTGVDSDAVFCWLSASCFERQPMAAASSTSRMSVARVPKMVTLVTVANGKENGVLRHGRSSRIEKIHSQWHKNSGHSQGDRPVGTCWRIR